MKSKKKLYIAISIIAGSLILLGITTLILFKTHILCIHKWQDANCENPVTCSICEKTIGDPVGHHWEDATCTVAKTCDICGKTDGDALGHKWADATCTAAKTCSVCGATEGEALGHKWVAATYSVPKTCSVCGKTEGYALTRPSTTSSSNSNTNDSTANNNSASNSTVTTVTRRCASCNKILTNGQLAYCSSHDCGEHGCPYPAKKVGSSYGSYCEFHSCRYPGCLSKPMLGNSDGYCSKHKE